MENLTDHSKDDNGFETSTIPEVVQDLNKDENLDSESSIIDLESSDINATNDEEKDNRSTKVKLDEEDESLTHNDHDKTNETKLSSKEEKELNSDQTVEEDQYMLTTIDNPFSPKTEYDMWKKWDSDNGYDTEEYIARLIIMESEYDIDDEFALNMLTSKVINEILENDVLEVYRLV